MKSVLFFLLVLSMIAVVGVLVAGIVSMTKGGEFNRKYGQKLMRWRVYLQAVALALFASLLLMGS